MHSTAQPPTTRLHHYNFTIIEIYIISLSSCFPFLYSSLYISLFYTYIIFSRHHLSKYSKTTITHQLLTESVWWWCILLFHFLMASSSLSSVLLIFKQWSTYIIFLSDTQPKSPPWTEMKEGRWIFWRRTEKIYCLMVNVMQKSRHRSEFTGSCVQNTRVHHTEARLSRV